RDHPHAGRRVRQFYDPAHDRRGRHGLPQAQHAVLLVHVAGVRDHPGRLFRRRRCPRHPPDVLPRALPLSHCRPGGVSNPPPARAGTGHGQICWLLALLFVGVSSMMGSVNYATTIINLRAPGMTFNRMPLTIWALFITSILQAFALPVLTVALILQLMDKTFNTSFFLPPGITDLNNWHSGPGGGQTLLWQHLFWFYSH